jgi:1-acyl-sn-glycerol-3-phosphate acyltransferase
MRFNNKIKESAFLRGILYFFIGIFSYPGLCIFNKLKVTGMEKLKTLPKEKVLFVSNHHTYFADVITLVHIFCASKWGKNKGLGVPTYLLFPFTRVRYVAADSTMKSSFLSKIFTLAGAITVKRTWAPNTGEQRNSINPGDTRNILNALNENWVITFPQGTTKEFAAGRKGTAYIIKQVKPIVIPVVINGFRTAFDKKGLQMKKKGTKLSVQFKDPLDINYDDSMEDILEQIMDSIEQSKKFQPKIV